MKRLVVSLVFLITFVLFFAYRINANAASGGATAIFTYDSKTVLTVENISAGDHTLNDIASEFINEFSGVASYEYSGSTIDSSTDTITFTEGNSFTVDMNLTVTATIDTINYYGKIDGTSMSLLGVDSTTISIPSEVTIGSDIITISSISSYFSKISNQAATSLILSSAGLTINSGAFADFSNLEYVYIEQGISIPNDTFNLTISSSVDIVCDASNIDFASAGITISSINAIYDLGNSLTNTALGSRDKPIYYYKESLTSTDFGYFNVSSNKASVTEYDIIPFNNESINSIFKPVIKTGEDNPTITLIDTRTDTTLVEGTDYSVTYDFLSETAGTIIVTSLNRIYLDAEFTFIINENSIYLNDYDIDITNLCVSYTGSEITVSDVFARVISDYPSITATGDTATSASDTALSFTLTLAGAIFSYYSESDNAYTYFNDSISGSWYVKKLISQSDYGSLITIPDYTFPNTAYTIGGYGGYGTTVGWPSVDVLYNDITLTSGTDYDVTTEVLDDAGNTYMNGSETGISDADSNMTVYTVKYTMEFMGEYSGTIVITTKLVPSISTAEIVYSNYEYTNSTFYYYKYTGSTIKPDLSLNIVYNSNTYTLTEGVDFELEEDSSRDYINASNDSVYYYVNGIGNYGGSTSANFIICRYSLDDVDIITNETYFGDPYIIMVNDGEVVEEINYSVTYTSGTMTITGRGIYYGEVNKTYTESSLELTEIGSFSIEALDTTYLSDNSSGMSLEFLYTESEINPTFTISDETDTLTSGTDYLVYAFNNIGPNILNGSAITDAKQMLVIIAGKGSYAGFSTYNFDITFTEVSLADLSLTYSGSAIDLTDISIAGVESITSDTDIIDAKDYSVTINSNYGYGAIKDNEYVRSYTDTITVNPFAVTADTLFSPTYELLSYAISLSGAAVEPNILSIDVTDANLETTLTKDDFTIDSYENNTESGTGTINVSLLTNNILAPDNIITVTFEIKGSSVADLFDITSVSADYSDGTNLYLLKTGEQIKPAVTLGSLVLDTDYSITYGENITDTGSITVAGLGDYGGIKTIEFIISEYIFLESNTSITYIDKLDIFESPTYAITGETIKPSITVLYNDIELDITNYTLSYGENISEVGTINLLGSGDFVGELEYSFDIINDISYFDIELSGFDEFKDEVYVYLYDGNIPNVKVSKVSINSNTYTDVAEIASFDYKDPGEYSLTINGTGTLTGNKFINIKIDATIVNPELKITYTGSAITEDELISSNDLTDILTLEFSEAINVGVYDVTINLNKGYAYLNEDIYYSSYASTFEIVKKTLEKADVLLKTTTKTYTGSEITDIELMYGDILFVKDSDYEAIFENNINVGVATVTISLIGNYEALESFSYEFIIEALTLLKSDLEFSITDELVYTGSEITPTINLSYNDKSLALDSDYSLSFKNNINAGTANALITLINNYNSEELVFDFTINPLSLLKSDLEFTLTNDIFYATGSEITPEFSIKYNNIEFSVDSEYTFEYLNNINPGMASIVVNLINNYKNSEDLIYNFEILTKQLFNIESVYTGKVIYMMDILKQMGIDGAIERIKNGDYSARYAGTYTCYVILKDGYSLDDEGLITEGEYSWRINPFEIDINEVNLSISDQGYTGSEIIPAINISYKDREIRSEDFDLVLENNINIGVAKATITLKNNFICEGSIVSEFNIIESDIYVKEYINNIVKSFGTYTDSDVVSLIDSIKKLANSNDIKELYLKYIPNIISNKMLAIGGYKTSIKDIKDSDLEGLENILNYYNDLSSYINENNYVSLIKSTVNEDITLDDLTSSVKDVLDLLVSDLGYTSFNSFVSDLKNASIIEAEKANSLNEAEKQIRNCDKVSVLTVMAHQKAELEAQEYIVQTDDDTRDDYLESFKEEVYRQRLLYQIMLQHQIAQTRSINSVTEIYNNLLTEQTYNEIELAKLKSILDEYVESINALEYKETEEAEVELIYEMASMATKAITDLYNVGVSTIATENVIITTSTGMSKSIVVEYGESNEITNDNVASALASGVKSSLDLTKDELTDLVKNRDVQKSINITLIDNELEVSEFDGVYTVKLLLTEDLRNVKNIVIVYIATDGTLEVLPTRVEGDYLIFETTHFSTYTVIGNRVYDLGWLLILLLSTFVIEALLVLYLLKLNKMYGNKKALMVMAILPSGFIGYLIALIVLNIIAIVFIFYLIKRLLKSLDKEDNSCE